MLFQVLDVLICNPCALVQLLALDNLLVLLAEESLLELDSLGIGAGKLLDLIIESGHRLFYLVTISQGCVELAVGFLNSEDFLVNSLCQCADSVVQLAIFPIKHLKSEFLILNFLLTPALVSLELEYVVLLLLLNVMAISDFSVKTFDVPSQGLIVEAHLLEIRGSSGDFDISVLDLTLHLLGLLIIGNPLVLAVLDLFLVLLEITLEDLNGLLLITDPVLVVSLLASDIVLEDS